MINPIALKVLSIIPLNDVPGNTITGLNNLTNNGSSRKFTDFFPEEMARVDYQVSENTRLFVRYGQNDLSEARSFRYSTTSATNVAETSGNAPFERNNNSATVQLTHAFNATTVMELRTGLLYFLTEQSGNNFGANYSLTSLGFSPQYAAEAVPYFPKFNWTNYEGAGSQPPQYNPVSANLTFQGSIAKTLGRNTLRLGTDFRLQRVNEIAPGYVAGNFSFDQQLTGANPLQTQPSSGNSIASFLLGTPQSGFINVNNDPARQQKLFSLFAQDDFRVNQRLTVNFGLRWDYLGPMTDRFNAITRGFAFTTPSPLQVPGLNLVGGLLYAGNNGAPRGAFNQHWRNFGPRAGIAYRLNEKTVLRAGYGLFYAQDFNEPGNAPGYSQTTNMVTSIQAGVPANTLTNPFPNGILTPVGNTQGLATNLGQSFSFADSDGGVPFVQQFSVDIQRELPSRILVSLGYVGSRSRHLEVSQSLNVLSAQNLALGPTYLNQSVPNPFAGLIPGTSLNGSTITRQQLLLPYPQFLGITENYEPIGKAKYDGLQALVAKRVGSDLSVSAAYTYSKTFNWTNFLNQQSPALEKVIASWDVTNSLQINGVYDLPFGSNKRYGASLLSPIRYLVSGWEISALGRFQSGLPLPFPANAAPTGVNPAINNPNLGLWFNTCTLLANGTTRGCAANQQPAWTIRQPDTLQMWSSYISQIRMPGIHNLDVSVLKSNRLTERVNLILRADFINATNSPQFYSGPIDDVNNANFGHIAGAEDQTNLPRFVQFSLKLQF